MCAGRIDMCFLVLGFFCFFVPVIADCNNTSDNNTFSYSKFQGYQYRVAYVANVPDVRDYETFHVTSLIINEYYYIISTINKLNGDQLNIRYIVNKDDGPTVNKTCISNCPNNKPVMYTVSVYGYMPNCYVQIRVRGEGVHPELRYALVFGDNPVDMEMLKDFSANDSKLGFKSKLVPIGKVKV